MVVVVGVEIVIFKFIYVVFNVVFDVVRVQFGVVRWGFFFCYGVDVVKVGISCFDQSSVSFNFVFEFQVYIGCLNLAVGEFEGESIGWCAAVAVKSSYFKVYVC